MNKKNLLSAFLILTNISGIFAYETTSIIVENLVDFATSSETVNRTVLSSFNAATAGAKATFDAAKLGAKATYKAATLDNLLLASALAHKAYINREKIASIASSTKTPNVIQKAVKSINSATEKSVQYLSNKMKVLKPVVTATEKIANSTKDDILNAVSNIVITERCFLSKEPISIATRQIRSILWPTMAFANIYGRLNNNRTNYTSAFYALLLSNSFNTIHSLNRELKKKTINK